MKKIVPTLIVLFVFGISCNRNLLNISPQDRISGDVVWSDPGLIAAYENSLYNAIPHGFYIHMYSKFTDEAYDDAPCCGADLFVHNTYNADNITGVSGGDFWGGYMYYWNRGYQYIQKANIFLQKMQDSNVQVTDKKRLVAEVHFLRAFMYFNLIERFGGVPIDTTAYALSDTSTVKFKRSTFDECVSFIESDLNAAMPNLPAKYASTDPNFGRATQDAAMALSSRTLLYAASPLWNPNNDKQKWQKAADAAKALIDRNDYTLYPDYRKLFTLPSGAAENEYIFARTFSSTNYHQAPMNNLGRRWGAYGGWWGSNGPTQNLVDAYDMANGQPAFNYGSDGVVESGVNPTSGYDPNHPYQNRDPRFDATIIHDSTVYHGALYGMWVAKDGSQWGYDSYKESGDNPRTNYQLKKFMPYSDVPLTWQTHYTNPWPYFRLAEIYLNYAEAEFNLGDEATCREYMDKVRARVGMPAIPSTVTGAELRTRLYNERRVELAFEGQRFFDVRRWKILDKVENNPVMGIQITKDMTTGVKTYTPVKLSQKIPYDPRMLLLPISNDEIRRTGMQQNPGW